MRAGRPGFGYSYALQQLSGRWDAARMDAWLAAPRRLVPGTSMAYPGLPDALDRADMIAYLETQGDYVESIDVVSGAIVITYGAAAHQTLQGLTLTIVPARWASPSATTTGPV